MESPSKRGLKNRNANTGGNRLADDAPGSRSGHAARILLSAPRSKSSASRCLRCRNDEEANPASRAGRRMSGLTQLQRTTTHRAPASAEEGEQASHVRKDTAQPANTLVPSMASEATRNSADGVVAVPLNRSAAEAAILPGRRWGAEGDCVRKSGRAVAVKCKCRLEIE